MTASIIFILLSILVLIAASAFFSGSETALTAVSKARMHSLEQGGDLQAGKVSYLIDMKERLIGALLLANNLVNILASALATSLFIALFGELGVVVATVVMTVIVVIFAEVLPKSWAISNPDRFALTVATPVGLLVRLFGPVTGVVTWIVRLILRVIRVDMDGTSTLTGHDELRGTVDVLNREGAVAKDDRDRVGGVLDLHELDLADVMVHRTGMTSVNADDPADQLVEQILNSQHTRIPVWEGEADNIIGIIHAKDMARALAAVDYNLTQFDIRKSMVEPWFVPES
ncbi:MAG: CNNM domain-containing protein, partial [Pseudomonadota bacterium]